VVIGFGENPNIMINPTNPDRVHRPANTEMYLLVIDDPSVIFEIQEDSDGGALTSGAAGSLADLVVVAGSTVTGKSGMEIDSSSSTDGTGTTVRLMRVANKEDNALGDNCLWEVMIVKHELNLATGV
jgi:hypothetical protein